MLNFDTPVDRLAFEASVEVGRLQDRCDTLERLVFILLHISRETEDFWPFVTDEEKKFAADFFDEMRGKYS